MANKQFDILNNKLNKILNLLDRVWEQLSSEEFLSLDDPADERDYEDPVHPVVGRPYEVKGYNGAPDYMVVESELSPLLVEAIQVSESMGLMYQLYEAKDGIKIMADNAVSAELHRRHTSQAGDA